MTGPTAGPELERARELLGQVMPAFLAAAVAEQRVGWQALASGFSAPAGVELRRVELGGVPAEEVRAPGAGAAGVVLHLHGGGYVIGSPATHRALTVAMSAASGATVVAPEYRLAPEHRFPAALEDALSVYRAVVAEVGDPAAVAVSGDSAGAGLALAMLGRAREEGMARPAAVVCWSPWVDLAAGPRPAAADDPVLSADWLARCARQYVGDADPADPLVSPVRAELGGLAPLLVLVGTSELLAVDAAGLAERAAHDGVEVELAEYPGAMHLWFLLAPDAPESRAALQRAGEFLRRRLAAGPGRRS